MARHVLAGLKYRHSYLDIHFYSTEKSHQTVKLIYEGVVEHAALCLLNSINRPFPSCCDPH